MTLASSKDSPRKATYPRTLSSIVVSLGGLAMFLIVASFLLVSHPIGSTVRGYFYDVVSSQRIDLVISQNNQSEIDPRLDSNADVSDKNLPTQSNLSSESNSTVPPESYSQVPLSSSDPTIASETKETVDQSEPVLELSSGLIQDEEVKTSSDFSNVTEHVEIARPVMPGLSNNSAIVDVGSKDTTPTSDSNLGPVSSGFTQEEEAKTDSDSSNVTENIEIAKPGLPGLLNSSNNLNAGSNDTTPASSASNPLPSNSTETGSVASGCDLYHGNWFYDSLGPSYTNNSCPIVSQMQNCQGNGRPDKEYENWRWKPFQCDLPRFDAKKFLELMRGKTLAFIGDSVARNHMESMLCILWQEEVPKPRGNKKMQRWFFRSTSTYIIRIWSSWLVHKTSEPFDFAPEGVVKLHLDVPDEELMEDIKKFDVVVISSGHWFAKQSVYILNNEIVGGQSWWPNSSRPKKINSNEAFEISVETFLTAVVTHPNYTGLTIVRSYSPDHYEGGAWNTGGSCTGKVRPLVAGELVENVHTNKMHEKQVSGFNRAIKKATNKSKLRYMDITEAFAYRHDGHPGPYRNKDPNKLTKRGPDGKPPPQDCLHWCMPGPIDTWNELVLEIIRREFDTNQNSSS